MSGGRQIRRGILALLVGLSALWLSACTAPHPDPGTPGQPLPPRAAETLRIASYNVHFIRADLAEGPWSLADWEGRKHGLDAAFKALDADLPGNHFSFSVFYQYKDFWASPTLEVISGQESGLRLGFNQDVSIFTLGYEVYPFSGFGYGRIGVNLLKTKDDHEYKKADVVVDFKALLDRGGYYSNYKWEMLEINEHKVNASIGHMYGTYTNSVINSHPQTRGQYFQLNLGLESYLFDLKPKWQANPYLGAGLGLKVESTFSGQDPDIPTQNSTSPLAYADVGIRLGGPVRMISKSTLLGIVVGDIVSLPFSTQQQDLPGQTLSVLEIKNNFYIGFNFVIDM